MFPSKTALAREKKTDFPQSSETAIKSNILASSFQKLGEQVSLVCFTIPRSLGGLISWQLNIFLAKLNYFNVARFSTRSAND